jgi:hypothetical protein
MGELVSGMPAPQFGDESSECEHQAWFKAQGSSGSCAYTRLKTTALDGQEIPHLSLYPKFNFHIHKNSPLNRSMSNMNPFHTPEFLSDSF